jgi:hypothetical protein
MQPHWRLRHDAADNNPVSPTHHDDEQHEHHGNQQHVDLIKHDEHNDDRVDHDQHDDYYSAGQ